MHSAFRDTWKKDGWVRPYLSAYKGVLVAAIVMSVVAYVFSAALMFTSGYMITLAATLPLTVLALHIPSIFVRIFGIGKPVIQYFERLASHDWVLRMTSRLRERLYEAVEHKASKTPGRLLALFASDIEHIQDLYLRTILPLIVMLIIYALVVIALGIFSPVMGLLFLVLIAFSVLVLPLWSLAANGARIARQGELTTEMYDTLTEDVAGIVDWKLSGRRDDFLSRAQGMYDERYKAVRAQHRFNRRAQILRQVVNALALVLLFVWAASVFGAAASGLIGAVAPGSMGAGGESVAVVATGAVRELGNFTMHDSLAYAPNWIAAFVLCAFPLLEVFAQADEAMEGFATHEGALRELNSLEEESRSGDGSYGGTSTDAGARGGEGTSKARRFPVKESSHAIELDKVSFAYRSGAPHLFDEVSLDIKLGEHLAIIGRSGIGKSTLLDLIRGVSQASAGEVRVQGCIGIVEQAPYLFRKSLRENMLVANTSATDEEIKGALVAVSLGELVDSLPQGLDTLISEGALELSGGERHRLALARILLAKSDIVLLDEPYLGLDAQTEREVSSTLFSLFADKTLVVVTHHLQGIDKFDRVVMMGKGGIAASGTPRELASASSTFRDLLALEGIDRNSFTQA